MTRTEQRQFVRALTSAVAKRLLKTANDWPQDWDGHELRELIAQAFDNERSRLLNAQAHRKRRIACRNEIATKNLY